MAPLSDSLSILALLIALLPVPEGARVSEFSPITRKSRKLLENSLRTEDPCELELGSNLAFHRATNRCYELNSPGPCSENMIFYSSRYPSKYFGDCFCDRSQPCVYNSSTKKCHVLFQKAYCSDGYWLRLNEFSNLDCEPNPCLNDSINRIDIPGQNYVLLNGDCAKLGDDCGISAVVGFPSGSFEPKCILKPQGMTSTITHSESIFCENGTHWSENLKVCEISNVEDESNDFRFVALNATNVFRVKHHAAPIIDDEAITKIAQAYADKLSRENRFNHSMREGYGENLYYYKGAAKSKSDLVLEAIKAWYDEVKDYDYNIPLFDSHTAHFTQLVWKRSERQGVGIALNPTTNYSVVVINYTPPGNWEGEFFENVRRPFNPNDTVSDFDDELFTIF